MPAAAQEHFYKVQVNRSVKENSTGSLRIGYALRTRCPRGWPLSGVENHGGGIPQKIKQYCRCSGMKSRSSFVALILHKCEVFIQQLPRQNVKHLPRSRLSTPGRFFSASNDPSSVLMPQHDPQSEVGRDLAKTLRISYWLTRPAL